ncbi:lysophospholipid acyltransferase family protein [Alkalibacterium sp.]|nr:MAG: 1-acyl-sn-glycerol-3-phosphate acyltransferase [Alkalibacterium sp.]
MFYSFIRFIVRLLVWILNGRPDVQEKQNLPANENYILIAPHRSWIDPVFLVLAASPKHFSFMAKKELFKYPVFNWLIKKMNAFPVDRHKPGPSAIKTPVKILKETDLGVVIFPTGTRHSTELKGGAVTIAKMSKKPIIPVVYKGPYTFKSLIKREKASVRFGKPFTVERKLDGVDDINAHYSNLIQAEFDRLDSEI